MTQPEERERESEREGGKERETSTLITRLYCAIPFSSNLTAHHVLHSLIQNLTQSIKDHYMSSNLNNQIIGLVGYKDYLYLEM